MKARIGKYKNFFGPYQLAEALCFWVKEQPNEYGIPEKPNWVHQFGEWLAHGDIEPEQKVGEARPLVRENRKETLLYKFLLWIDSKRERKITVRIDPWDTWSMDDTLAHIVLPMLKQLKDQKHGAPCVDPEDLPDHLQPTDKQMQAFNKDGTTDDQFFERWNWVLDEMIFAFNTKAGDDQDWEDRFYSGESDWEFEKTNDGLYEMTKGKNHTAEIDWEGRKAYQARIANGFRLFGKYYENLWS